MAKVKDYEKIKCRKCKFCTNSFLDIWNLRCANRKRILIEAATQWRTSVPIAEVEIGTLETCYFYEVKNPWR